MFAGDGVREAYTAIVWGVGLSHDIPKIAEAETVTAVEGTRCDTALRGARVEGHITREGLHRNLGGLASDQLAFVPQRSASGR